ncbi:SLC13 family permease [Clostridiaceae bacterium 35-E11]
MTNKRKEKIISVFTCIIPILILFFLNSLNLHQRIILAATTLTISWWATGVVHRSFASILLIVVFISFGNIPLSIILKFPFSKTFFLIVFTFLLSEGIVKTNVADHIAQKLLQRVGNTPIKLIVLSFIMGTLLIFFIPQPFPRVILLSTIYIQYLKNERIDKNTFAIVLFSIYVASTCTSMMFLNGDILLNYVALQMGQVQLTWGQWAVYMAVPALMISTLILISFILVFKRRISNISFKVCHKAETEELLDKNKIQTLIIMFFVLVTFITQPIHHIEGVWIIFCSVAIMFLLKILTFNDLKKINIHLLIFLTAAFAIGGVLSHTGIIENIIAKYIKVMPKSVNSTYFFFLISMTMIVHLFLGSAVTTISVVLPMILRLNNMDINPVVLTLITYTVVSIHYILPFHQSTIMIGFGQNHYSNKEVFKFGCVLTFITFFGVLLIQIPWWKFLALLS